MMAERNTWREITRKMHMGKTLRVSLQEMQHDLLFWQREVSVAGGAEGKRFEKISIPTSERSIPEKHRQREVLTPISSL
jgi:hypothetical protein